MGQGQQRLDFAIAFLFQRPRQQRRHVGSDLALQFPGRCEANGALGIEQLECRQRASQFAANPVVDRNRLGVGRHPHLGAGGRVESLVAIDDHRLVASQVKAVLGHCLEDTHGIGVGGLRQLPDGGDLVAGVFGRQLIDLGRVEPGPRRQAAGQEQNYEYCFGHEGSVRNLCSAATDYGANREAGIR